MDEYCSKHGESTHVMGCEECSRKLRMRLSKQQQTNLNFWKAYQAMKRGEWVGYCSDQGHYFLNDDGILMYKMMCGKESEIEITKYHLDSTTWYIVPKGPRYKVGDRFSTSTQLQPNSLLDVIIREVVYVDEATKTYAVNKEVNMHRVGLEVITEDHLDHLHKIGSIPS